MCLYHASQSLRLLGDEGTVRTGVPDLEVLERGISGVLDVMTEGCRDIADVARLVVEGDSVARRRKDGHAASALEEIAPLVLGGVPL